MCHLMYYLTPVPPLSCPDLSVMPNTRLVSGGTHIQAVAVYYCDPHHAFPDGTIMRSTRCLVTGLWSVKSIGCNGECKPMS